MVIVCDLWFDVFCVLWNLIYHDIWYYVDTLFLFIIHPSSSTDPMGIFRFWVLYRAKEDGPVLLVCFRKQKHQICFAMSFWGLNVKDFEGNLMWWNRAGVILGMGMDMGMMMAMAKSHIRRYVCCIFSGKVLLQYSIGNYKKTSKVEEKSEFVRGEKTLY